MNVLFPKEEEIMQTIWKIGHPCVLSDILKTNPELKRNTVTKVLITLVQKGYIKVDSIVKTTTRTGRSYVPMVSCEEYEQQKALMDIIVGGSSTNNSILTYFSTLVSTQNVNAEFLDEIRRIINSYDKRTDDCEE